jgi:hypothetical protein
LHQTNQSTETAAVDEIYLVKLHHDFGVPGARVTKVCVQRVGIIAGDDAAKALYDQYIAYRTAFQT